MLVLIILIGGNYVWCLGGQAGKVQISKDFVLQQKMMHAQKVLGSFLRGQCCARLLTEWVLLRLVGDFRQCQQMLQAVCQLLEVSMNKRGLLASKST
jgi:hypothetical protein